MQIGKIRNKLRDPGFHVLGRPAPLVVIIAYKAAWGTVEVIVGTLILFSWRIITKELLEDPNDAIMHWLLTHMPFGPGQALPLGVAVLTFGAAKLLLAAGLWFRIRLTREIAVLLLSAAACYGVYQMRLGLTPLKLGAVAADLAILSYFIFFLPKHLDDAGMR